jgi:hypothetical protein
MEYMLLIYSDPQGWAQLTPAQAAEGMAAYGAYHEALQKAGVLKHSTRLRPGNTATTVRLKSGKTQVLDGPFIETREQLGGYFQIDVPDLDSALSWAARCPGAAHGVVEVRPVWPAGEP